MPTSIHSVFCFQIKPWAKKKILDVSLISILWNISEQQEYETFPSIHNILKQFSITPSYNKMHEHILEWTPKILCKAIMHRINLLLQTPSHNHTYSIRIHLSLIQNNIIPSKNTERSKNKSKPRVKDVLNSQILTTRYKICI